LRDLNKDIEREGEVKLANPHFENLNIKEEKR